MWDFGCCAFAHCMYTSGLKKKSVGILCSVTSLHAHTLRPPEGPLPHCDRRIYIGASKAHCDGRGVGAVRQAWALMERVRCAAAK
jgi:hypothetical protein